MDPPSDIRLATDCQTRHLVYHARNALKIINISLTYDSYDTFGLGVAGRLGRYSQYMEKKLMFQTTNQHGCIPSSQCAPYLAVLSSPPMPSFHRLCRDEQFSPPWRRYEAYISTLIVGSSNAYEHRSICTLFVRSIYS